MELKKISLPIAYMIETLRSHSVSNGELLAQIEKKDVSVWDDIQSSFDFNDLLQFAEEDSALFRSVIEDGYQVKFVTINGLQRLLQLKFDKLADRDYTLTENGVDHLQMNQQQIEILKQVLSDNWLIDENGAGLKVQLR
ncbi:MAG: hypothetical protein ACI4XS_06480 [Bacillus sp. (in: firmicutes)]